MTDSPYTRFLGTLAASPFFGWGVQPTVWAVLDGEPMVITGPVITTENVETLALFAQHVREHGLHQIPASTLLVVAEGDYSDGTGITIHGRELVVVTKDADLTVFRHVQADDSVTEVEFNPTVDSGPLVAAAREIGASAWPTE